MSSTSKLCERCGERPITVSELDQTTEPPTPLRLCDQCFTELMDARLQASMAKIGGKVEAMFRDAGSPLPSDLTGEQLVRGMLEEGRRYAGSPEAKRRTEAMARIVREVASELPGGTSSPEFRARVVARMKELISDQGSEAS